jgi:hypothetical protein
MKRHMLAVLAVLVAASAFALAAKAEPIAPGSGGSSGQVKAPPVSCDTLFNNYMTFAKHAASSMASGDRDNAIISLEAADGTLSAAREAGCGWAFTVKPPTLTPKPLPPLP